MDIQIKGVHSNEKKILLRGESMELVEIRQELTQMNTRMDEFRGSL